LAAGIIKQQRRGVQAISVKATIPLPVIMAAAIELQTQEREKIAAALTEVGLPGQGRRGIGSHPIGGIRIKRTISYAKEICQG
jgi:hypothetical protein